LTSVEVVADDKVGLCETHFQAMHAE